VAAGILAVAGVVAWLVFRPRTLPVLGVVPPFTLTERAGTPLTADRLSGRVWIADFVFTRCPDFCPALTARMAGLQKTLPPGPDAVLLVSFSVDPSHDSPEVLRDYAARAGAGDGWLFVTGARDAMATLLRDGFRVAFADDGPAASPITHSDRLVLIDRQLRIRGYYHGTDPADVARLVRDAEALRAGRAA
jgi:protein SCO1/2